MRFISIFFAAAVVAAPIAPPSAATVPYTQTFYGTQRSDPYHWMEAGGPDLAAFIKAQSDYTQALLSTNPGRPRVVRAVRDAFDRSAQATTTSAVDRIGSKVFFLQSLPGSSAPSLQVRVDGRAPRVVIDARSLPKASSRGTSRLRSAPKSHMALRPRAKLSIFTFATPTDRTIARRQSIVPSFRT
jgi:hypothetical protein